MTSRYVSIRPDNVPSNGVISHKGGFAVLGFTIQNQNGILDPRSIRINGKLRVFKDNLANPTPVHTNDANQITMNNRCGIFGMFDQLMIKHEKSNQICEHIRYYNRYMNAYLGTTSSKQDLMGHFNETALIEPNPECMFQNVVASGTSAAGKNIPKSFSVHLPSGFMLSGNSINLMENSFGGIKIEIYLSPDSNCLFSRNGVLAGIGEAHYTLEDLSLTCEIHDIAPDDMATFASQTEGAMTFQTIDSIFTTINSGNAQIQYNLGLRKLQSAFMTFIPSSYINTLTADGLASVYPSNAAGDTLVNFTRIQFLRGGVKYPMDFDITTNKTISGNATATNESFNTADPQLALQFTESIIPEMLMDKTSLSQNNLNRNYNLLNTGGVNSYKSQIDGGALFGIGLRYSQYNQGQDFSSQQFGVSLESSITDNNPIGVFIFLKSQKTLMFNANGVQIMN